MKSFFPFLTALALIGCESHSSTTYIPAKSATVAATTLPPELIGKWKGKVNQKPVDKTNPGAKLGEALTDMFTEGLTLEFPDDSHFKMTFMMIPVEGKVERTGKNLTLITEKVAGMTEAQAKELQQPGAKGPDFNEPLNAQISEDGKSILLLGTKSATESVTFTRDTETEKPVFSTVSTAESPYVGKWSPDMSTVDISSMSAEEKKDWPNSKAIIEGSSIELKADNTFKFSIMVEIEGKWKVDGNRIRMTPGAMMGMDSKDAKQDPIWLTPNGDLLMIESENGKGPKLGYRR